MGYVTEGVVVHGTAALPPKGKGKGKARFALQEDSLDVRYVHLPPDAMETRGSINFFAVDVARRDGKTCRVMRRYKDFRNLFERLGSPSFAGAPFPRKHYRGCTGQRLEDRRRALETWLERMIDGPAFGGAW